MSLLLDKAEGIRANVNATIMKNVRVQSVSPRIRPQCPCSGQDENHFGRTADSSEANLYIVGLRRVLQRHSYQRYSVPASTSCKIAVTLFLYPSLRRPVPTKAAVYPVPVVASLFPRPRMPLRQRTFPSAPSTHLKQAMNKKEPVLC